MGHHIDDLVPRTVRGSLAVDAPVARAQRVVRVVDLGREVGGVEVRRLVALRESIVGLRRGAGQADDPIAVSAPSAAFLAILRVAVITGFLSVSTCRREV
jgi:hypothetical protein